MFGIFCNFFEGAETLKNKTPPMRKHDFSGSEGKDFHDLGVHFSRQILEPFFIVFSSIWDAFGTPFWVTFGIIFDPIFQTSKNKKIQMAVESRGGYLGHISDKGGTERHGPHPCEP